MENLKFRKKQPTYGKSNKKFPIHQIFDTTPLSEKSEGFVTTLNSPSTLRKAQVPGTANRARDSAEEVEQSQLDSILDFDLARSMPRSTAQIIDTYDLESSDDDTQDSGYSDPKRRKLTPQLNEEMLEEPLSATDRPMSRKIETKGRTAQKLQNFNRIKPILASNIGSKNTTNSRVIDLDDESIVAVDSPSPRRIASPVRAELDDSPPATPPRQPRKDAATSGPRTPRHQRPLLPGGLDKQTVDSPSQLGLRSLRLTPGRTTPEKRDIFDEVAAFPTQLTPRRGRQRLVDRLDAPSKPSSHSPSPTGARKDTSRSSSIGGRAKIVPASLVKEASFDINLDTTIDLTSSQEYTAPVKSKRSYAQQRSYLTDPTLKSTLDMDIGDRNDVHSLVPSQNQSETYGSSQLELEEIDDDEPTAGTGTKSIHELRRAGANNRFEREIEALFDDLEAIDSTRSVRIHALTNLLEHILAPEYATRFLETQLEIRLSNVAIRDVDMLTSTLFTSIFLVLTGIDGRPDIPKKVQNAVACLAVTQLLEKRSLTTLAKERKANLSKLVIKDITEAEQKLLPFLAWDTMMPERVSPQLFAISTLASMTKALRLNGQAFVNSSEAFLKEIFQVVEEANSDAATTNDNFLLIKAAMSFLENSSQTSSALGLDEPRSFASFANTLSNVLRTFGKQRVELQQICLRTIVNLSNNEAQVSTILATTPVLEEIFEVIRHNFDPLANAADADQVVDQDQLNSVILALGCLMNLVECSEEARNRFFEMGTPPRSSVDWLLDRFDLRVEKSFSVSIVPQELHRLTKLTILLGVHYRADPSLGRIWLCLSVALQLMFGVILQTICAESLAG